MAAKGRVTYRAYCANCHGLKGAGDGNLTKYLSAEPANLTLLREKNEGEFPNALIHKIIDGREDVRGHGGEEMPIWGEVFQIPLALDSSINDDTDEERAQRKIRELVLYLESMQIE